MIESDFNNLSGQPDGKQTSTQIEKERVRKIEKITNGLERRKGHTMLGKRDYLFDTKKAEAEIQITNKIDEKMRENVTLKAGLHIKPPIGVGSYTPHQRRNFIEKQVRNSLGSKLEKGIKDFKKTENKKIDAFVDKTLEKQTRTAEDISKSAKQRFKERAESRQNNKTRGRGRDHSR